MIHALKNRIDCLSSTLRNCAFNHFRLKTLFQKKQAPHVHAHHPRHTYAHFAHHDHTHSHMHTRVYKCTHYDRKGHLAKFCFDKINHILILLIKMLGFQIMLTLVDPKENGYQNPHFLCMM